MDTLSCLVRLTIKFIRRQEFSWSEIQAISKLLNLSDEEILNIFNEQCP